MSEDDILTDDYVAGLLAQEANDCSLRYSTMGMDTKKKPASMPKPNKRFLRHIIRDTDTHNRALLAKEASESKARLRDLEEAEESRRRRTNPDARDIRRRQMGDIHAILGSRKQTKDDVDDHASDCEPRRSKDDKGRTRGRKSDSREHTTEHNGHSRHRRDRSTERHSTRRHRSSDRDERRQKRARRDRSSSRDDNRHHNRSRRDRSRSPRRKASRSPRDSTSRYRRRSRHRSPVADATRTSGRLEREQPEDQGSDSDPLDDLIGPAPPPRHRGRGTIGGALDLDRRFSASYDPRADVQVNDAGEDGWDDAVETYRDRQKLRLNQAQRMKEAGFTDAQIKHMEDGGEKSEKDVVWSKAGEKRAWDQGKSLDGSPARLPTLFSEDY